MTPEGLMSALVAVALLAVLLAVLRGFSHEHECESPLTVKQPGSCRPGSTVLHGAVDPESPPSTDPDVDGPSFSSGEDTVLALYIIRRWKDDLLLHDRFETVADYVQHVDRMFLGLVRFEPALLPPSDSCREKTKES